MIKIYNKLTNEQIKRKVIFSSCLSKSRTEQENEKIHEVFNTDEDGNETIKRLLDDKFFNGSPWSFNIIRQ